MKPDEKLTKQTGRPVIKGVMDEGDLDIGGVEPPEEPLEPDPRLEPRPHDPDNDE